MSGFNKNSGSHNINKSQKITGQWVLLWSQNGPFSFICEPVLNGFNCYHCDLIDNQIVVRIRMSVCTSVHLHILKGPCHLFQLYEDTLCTMSVYPSVHLSVFAVKKSNHHQSEGICLCLAT